MFCHLYGTFCHLHGTFWAVLILFWHKLHSNVQWESEVLVTWWFLFGSLESEWRQLWTLLFTVTTGAIKGTFCCFYIISYHKSTINGVCFPVGHFQNIFLDLFPLISLKGIFERSIISDTKWWVFWFVWRGNKETSAFLQSAAHEWCDIFRN